MKLRWGIIGASGISDECTIPGILKSNNSEVVAVMSRTMEKAEKIRQKYNVKKAYSNIDDLLQDEEVDVVYIATPVFDHKDSVIKSAKAKKHIFLEKPMGLNPEECEEMIQVCKENGVKLGLAFMMRFGDYHIKVKKLLEEKIIGDVINTRIQYSWWYPDDNVWRLDPKLSGGGTVVDLGSHCIDLIQYLLGTKIKNVAAMIGTKTFSYEVEDSAQIMCEMENGVFGAFNFHFNIPNSISNNTMEIYGTKGSIVCYDTIGREDVGRVVIKLAGENGLTDFADYSSEELAVEPVDRYTKEVEAFSDAVINNKETLVSGEDGLNVVKIASAIYKSAKDKTFEEIK
ncbi:MAG: Gfo/Idh/MocA family oxidoreductase [Clostridium lundense]|nr:Gfo/Idh/MocA family oxidoreductase [Clostridium lundense]